MYTGFQRVASAASVKDATHITIPSDTTFVEIQADTQPVRYTMDGTDPTASSGMLFLTTEGPKTFLVEDVRKIKFIQGSGGAGAINLHYFK